jgi:hypothetical protein
VRLTSDVTAYEREVHPAAEKTAVVVFAFACCTAFAVSVAIVLQPIDELLQIVPDDAFYYLKIASNLAASGWSTFDGTSPTNGYHPGWALLLMPLARLYGGNPILYLRLAMLLSVTLHVLTSIVLALTLRSVIGTFWSFAGAACWVVNRLPLLLALQTVEASAYQLALIVALALHLRLLRTDRSVARWFGYGLGLGLAYLARTEAIVLIALGGGYVAFAWLRQRESAPSLLAWAAGVLIPVFPWWIFQLAQVGTIVQDSGRMKMLWAAELFAAGPGRRLSNVADTALHFAGSFTLFFDALNRPKIGLLAAIGCGTALVSAAWRIHRVPLQVRAVLVCCGSAIGGALMIYSLAFTERQVWWLALPSLGLFTMTLVAFGDLWRSQRLPPQLAIASAAMALVLSGYLLATWFSDGAARRYPWQADVYRSQAAFEAAIDPSARLGFLNAGIPGFFTQRSFVALDGLVNHAARLAWERRAWADFVHQADVAFILDERWTLARAERFSDRRLTLIERQREPLTGWREPYRIAWEVGP